MPSASLPRNLLLPPELCFPREPSVVPLLGLRSPGFAHCGEASRPAAFVPTSGFHRPERGCWAEAELLWGFDVNRSLCPWGASVLMEGPGSRVGRKHGRKPGKE